MVMRSGTTDTAGEVLRIFVRVGTLVVALGGCQRYGATLNKKIRLM
jgi:hypothetical protein